MQKQKVLFFSRGWLSGCGSLEVEEKKNILACVNKEYWNNRCHVDFLIDIYNETGNL